MNLTPFATWALITVVVGLPTLAVWCCLALSGRLAEAEREITEAELGAALARNRYPAKTMVRTICKVCHQQIDRHPIDYRPDLGAVHIVDGLHLRCRRGPEIVIDFDDHESAEHLARHLRTLEGVQEPA